MDAAPVNGMGPGGETIMMKLRALGIAAVAAGGLAFAAASPAAAAWHGHWDHDGGGGAVAAGVIGGLAAGAIIGSAAAAPYYYYGPGPYYAGPVYAPGPYCHWARERVWVNGIGWRIARVQVCD
jgi:hypothetical protein